MSNFRIYPPAAEVAENCLACYKTNATWGLSPKIGQSGNPGFLIVRLIASFVLATGFAFAGSKVSPDMPKGSPNTMVAVIVRYKNQPTNDQMNQLGQNG